jgi:hypothetical protein
VFLNLRAAAQYQALASIIIKEFTRLRSHRGLEVNYFSILQHFQHVEWCFAILRRCQHVEWCFAILRRCQHVEW